MNHRKFGFASALVFAVAIASVGCAGQTEVSKPPTPPEQPRKDTSDTNNHNCVVASGGDNFDKAGRAVATGSRWVYDSASQAWYFLSNQEAQDRYSRWLEAVKKEAKKLKDKVSTDK